MTGGRMSAPAWIVVEAPGTDREIVLSEHATSHAARRELRERQDDGEFVDLMKRESDGTLTTEF